MSKRLISVFSALGLLAGAFTALPAKAQTTPVPATVNIEDPSGDSNGLNDQGLGLGIGDNSGGVSIGAADILKVWFTNSDTTVSAHILTTFPPPNMTPGVGLLYRVQLNDDCTYLQGLVPSRTYVGAQKANVREFCGDSGTTEGGEITIEALEDGTGITTLKYPLGLHPALQMGATLATPVATARAAHGTDSPALYSPQLDDTKVGTDYTIASGGAVVEEPKEEVKKDKKAKKTKKPKAKKGKKGKKKKGKKKKAAAPSCPAYVPGEHGAEAELIAVTDKATAEKPVEVTFDAGRGMGGPLIGGVPVPPDQRTHNYHNVQVDSDSADVGLYVRLEFPDRRDYDLYLEYPDGTEATHSGDFNTLHEGFSCGGAATGCEGSSNFEQVNGIRTADCGGWTVDSVAYLTEGGDVTLKLWLGEATTDPAAPAQQSTLAAFWELLLGR